MTRNEVLQRLRTIRARGIQALELLEVKNLSPEQQVAIQTIARELKEELQSEYRRMLPTRAQKTMSMYELSIYSPTIEEAWTDTGISRLRTDEIPDERWYKAFEALVYKAGQYVS